jgi:hypothetical protein
MGQPFNHGAWISQVSQRLNSIEHAIRNNKPPTNGKTGISDLDPREADVLKRAFVGLEQEFDVVRRDLVSVAQEHKDLTTLLSGLHGTSRALEQGYTGVDARLSELAYQVQAYTQVVQGIAIQPLRAVPSVKLNERTGAPEINPVKVHTKTFWLASTPRTITIPANGSQKVSFVVPPEQNLEGDLEIFFLELASATSQNIRVRLTHTGLNKFLMNQPCHIMSVFGNMNGGPQPFQMYESIFLEPNLELTVEFFDFSGLPNTVEPIVHGRKFIGYATSGMDRRGLIDSFARNTWPYWITTDQPVVLSVAPATTPIQFTQERQFHAELAKVMQFGTNAGAPAPVFYHISLNEGMSGNLIADNVPILTFAGNSNFPFPLPEPYLMLRGTILAGVLTNDAALPSLGTDIVFHGRALPISYPGQRALEPAFDARNQGIQMPPSHKDLAIARMVSQ